MACEKCWGDAFLRSYGRFDTDQPTEYRKLLEERKDKPCTPEQERGEIIRNDAPGICPQIRAAILRLQAVHARMIGDGYTHGTGIELNAIRDDLALIARRVKP